MSSVLVYQSKIKFETVEQALEQAGFKKSPHAHECLLIWFDSLKEKSYFTKIKFYHIVNRLPGAQVLCRKVPFGMILNYFKSKFPLYFSFFPKTFIIPHENETFCKYLKTSDKNFLLKPDSGSFGQGIVFLQSCTNYTPIEGDYIAQEYLESYLYNEYKFDLRIYVLIVSIFPLQICVFRDGLARFCSEPYKNGTAFSRITNVGLNKTHENVKIEEISQLLSEFFPKLHSLGINTEKIWREIDSCIILAILSSYKYLSEAVKNQCPPLIYNRCFQIFGFDILLDPELHPHLLEVNFRPSLGFYRPKERRMKEKMLREALEIAVPVNELQKAFSSREWCWNYQTWFGYLNANYEIIEDITIKRKNAIQRSNYEQIWPLSTDVPQLYQEVYQEAMKMKLFDLPGITIKNNSDCSIAGT